MHRTDEGRVDLRKSVLIFRGSPKVLRVRRSLFGWTGEPVLFPSEFRVCRHWSFSKKSETLRVVSESFFSLSLERQRSAGEAAHRCRYHGCARASVFDRSRKFYESAQRERPRRAGWTFDGAEMEDEAIATDRAQSENRCMHVFDFVPEQCAIVHSQRFVLQQTMPASASCEAFTCRWSKISREISCRELESRKFSKKWDTVSLFWELLFPFAGAPAKCRRNGPSLQIRTAIRVRQTPKVLKIRSSFVRVCRIYDGAQMGGERQTEPELKRCGSTRVRCWCINTSVTCDPRQNKELDLAAGYSALRSAFTQMGWLATAVSGWAICKPAQTTPCMQGRDKQQIFRGVRQPAYPSCSSRLFLRSLHVRHRYKQSSPMITHASNSPPEPKNKLVKDFLKDTRKKGSWRTEKGEREALEMVGGQ